MSPQHTLVEHELLKPTALRNLLRSPNNVCGEVGANTWPPVQPGQVLINVPVTQVLLVVELMHTVSPPVTRSICASFSGSAAKAVLAKSGRTARPNTNFLIENPSSAIGQSAFDHRPLTRLRGGSSIARTTKNHTRANNATAQGL
jgi:hypothetical protein